MDGAYLLILMLLLSLQYQRDLNVLYTSSVLTSFPTFKLCYQYMICEFAVCAQQCLDVNISQEIGHGDA